MYVSSIQSQKTYETNILEYEEEITIETNNSRYFMHQMPNFLYL